MGCAASSVHASENSQCKDPKHKEYDNTIRAVTEQSRKESEGPLPKPPEKREISFGPVKLCQDTSRILLVFPVEDGQSEAFLWACRKGGYQCSIASSPLAVMETLEKKKHHIVVIDMRLPVYSVGEQIAKKIRLKASLSNIVLLAVCPAIPRWCEEPSVRPYLDMGFNRRYLENHDRGACLNEIVMVDQGEVMAGVKLSVANTLFQLLEESSESFDITDAEGLCSYVNPAFERLTGYRSSDIVQSSTEILLNAEKTGQEVVDALARHKAEGTTWKGVVINNRKGLDPISVEMKVMPVYDAEASSSDPSHFVTSRQELNPTTCRMCLNNKSQFVSTARRMSNGRVRAESSNTSINSMSLNSTNSRRLSKQVDAPIIKIFAMLRTIQDSSPSLPPNVIDNVMAMLRSSELYNPGSNSLTEDPEALGFMDGLMEIEPIIQRSSGSLLGTAEQPSLYDTGRGTRPSITGDAIISHRESTVTFNNTMMMQSLPIMIKDNLSRRKEWDYDVFELERLSNRKPLFYLGFDILVEFGILNIFKIDESILRNWLSLVESHYHSSNSYHNSTHAADVLQASAYFCRSHCMEQSLDPSDFLALLIASICHDIDHPGRTNAFLCNVGHDLAVLYNDSAVLESHHAAQTFTITCKSEKKNNIFQNLEPDNFKQIRKSIISMILATDMTQHFEYYNKFLAVNLKSGMGEEGDETCLQLPVSQENKTLILRMAIKCADISNPSRNIKLARAWAHRIVLEYRDQISEEKSRDLPQSLPQFDDIPKSQVLFVHLFAKDLLSAYNDFLEFSQLTDQLMETFEYWDSFDESNPYPHAHTLSTSGT